MKKGADLLIILIILLFVITFAFADVIPEPDEHMHHVASCPKIVNLNDFPDLVLVGYITGPMPSMNDPEAEYEAYQIENGKCLYGGYTFSKLDIYWTTKENFYSLDLKNLRLNSEKIATAGRDDNYNIVYMDKYTPVDLMLLSEDFGFSSGGYIDDNDPRIEDEFEYSIAGFCDNRLILYESKRISRYNNGDPDRISNKEFDIRESGCSHELSLRFEEPQKPPANCILWFDGCNECDVTDGEISSCTKKRCDIYETPQCLRFEAQDEPINPLEPSLPKKPVKEGFWNSIKCFFDRLLGRSCGTVITIYE